MGIRLQAQEVLAAPLEAASQLLPAQVDSAEHSLALDRMFGSYTFDAAQLEVSRTRHG